MTATDAKEWFEFLKGFRIEHLIIIVFVIAFAYLFVNPDIILVWKGIIQSVFVFSKEAQKSSISNRVCGSIKHATRKLPECDKALFPESVKIEWKDAENETRESFLNGKQVIVRMNRTNNINKTTSIAVIEMAKIGVLANGKRYMDNKVSAASDYLIARKLLAHIRNGDSLGYFDEIFFRPLYDNNSEFKEYFDQLLATDRNGMYTSVFLNEIRKMADALFPEPTNKCAQNDSVAFLRFLYELCTKDENASFRYPGYYIKVDVAFTGDSNVLYHEGYDFYVEKCHEALSNKMNTVYIFALGMKRDDAIGVEMLFQERYPNFATTKRTEYIHRFSDQHRKNGICIEFQRNV